MKEILLIGDCSRIQTPLVPSTKKIAICDLDGYLGDSTASAYILGDLSDECIEGALRRIRSHSTNGFAPIYQAPVAGKKHPLSDGDVPSQIMGELDKFQNRLTRLPDGVWSDQTSRLLAYLWLLPDRRIQPRRRPGSPEIYSYDLLSVWDPGDGAMWLNRALRRNLIEEDVLVDRLRFCPGCNSGHLNYVDQCPHCSSLDIVLEQAIHCFACGMVANQAQFRRQGRLVCPKCSAALKHIGADYDRPLETMKCNSCRHLFVDPSVNVACLDCDTQTAPNGLVVRNIQSYKLSAAGEEFLRNGGDAHKPTVVFGAPVDQGHFLWTLQWLNNMSSSELQGSGVVAGLHFSNLDALDSQFADNRFLRHAGGLDQQLESLLEPTDILLRYNDDTAFVLFPFETKSRLTGFLQEVQNIDLSQTTPEVEMKAMGRTLPDGMLQQDPENWLRSFAEELAA